MAVPSNWNLVPVRGRYIGTDDVPIYGKITFTPRATRVVDAAALAIIIQRSYTVQLDARGEFLIYLPATDDPDVSPINWTYEVIEDFKGGTTFDIEVPLVYLDSGLDLAAVSPISPNYGIGETPITREEFDDLAIQVEMITVRVEGGYPFSVYTQTALDGGTP